MWAVSVFTTGPDLGHGEKGRSSLVSEGTVASRPRSCPAPFPPPPKRLHLGTVLTVSSSGTRGWDALEGAHGPALQPGKLRPRWGGCFSSLPPLTHEVLISLTQSLLVSLLTPTASLSHRAWGP